MSPSETIFTRMNNPLCALILATAVLLALPARSSAGSMDVSNAHFEGGAEALPVVDSAGELESRAHVAIGAFPGLSMAEVGRLSGADLQAAFHQIGRQNFSVGSNVAGFFSAALWGLGSDVGGESVYLVIFDAPEIADSTDWFVYAYPVTWVADDPNFYSFQPLDLSTIEESRIVIGSLGGAADISGVPGQDGLSERSLVMGDQVLPEDYRLGSVTVTPGVADVTLGAAGISIEIDYETNNGTTPGGEVTLWPPSSLVAPVTIDLSGASLARSGTGGTFTLTYGLPGGSLSGAWSVDVTMTHDTAIPEPLVFEGAASFEVVDQFVGGSPDNPVLPDEVTADGGFRFNGLQPEFPQWIDPPMAFGYLYEIENGALITGIANLPEGIDADGKFEVFAPSFQSAVTEVESVDFESELGAGTKWFALTGIEPGAEASATDAFPVRLVFDSVATLKVTPLVIPEIEIDVSQSAGEHTTTLRWQGQDELDYRLYGSADLSNWVPVGDLVRGVDGPQSTTASSVDPSRSYRLGLSVHPLPAD